MNADGRPQALPAVAAIVRMSWTGVNGGVLVCRARPGGCSRNTADPVRSPYNRRPLVGGRISWA